MKHIRTINGKVFSLTKKGQGCGECRTSCQSACKTSCTVGNQRCERSVLKVDAAKNVIVE
jgi:predicted ribosomally synthesized six-cysteine peptide SCIFF